MSLGFSLGVGFVGISLGVFAKGSFSLEGIYGREIFFSLDIVLLVNDVSFCYRYLYGRGLDCWGVGDGRDSNVRFWFLMIRLIRRINYK